MYFFLNLDYKLKRFYVSTELKYKLTNIKYCKLTYCLNLVKITPRISFCPVWKCMIFGWFEYLRTNYIVGIWSITCVQG